MGECIGVTANFYGIILGRAACSAFPAHTAFSLQVMDTPYSPNCHPMNGSSVTAVRWEIISFFPEGLFRFTQPKLSYFLPISKSISSLLACEPWFCYHMDGQDV